ncbi:unnamed protein product [Amoebophrya sp. A120]|nr:unnamed protein product [Amoebophrya sp. A120]|eukprot:GSA120T00025135001.1
MRKRIQAHYLAGLAALSEPTTRHDARRGPATSRPYGSKHIARARCYRLNFLRKKSALLHPTLAVERYFSSCFRGRSLEVESSLRLPGFLLEELQHYLTLGRKRAQQEHSASSAAAPDEAKNKPVRIISTGRSPDLYQHLQRHVVGKKGYFTPRYFNGSVKWEFELQHPISEDAFYASCFLLPYYFPELLVDLKKQTGLRPQVPENFQPNEKKPHSSTFGESAKEHKSHAVQVDSSGLHKVLQEIGVADFGQQVFDYWPELQCHFFKFLRNASRNYETTRTRTTSEVGLLPERCTRNKPTSVEQNPSAGTAGSVDRHPPEVSKKVQDTTDVEPPSSPRTAAAAKQAAKQAFAASTFVVSRTRTKGSEWPLLDDAVHRGGKNYKPSGASTAKVDTNNSATSTCSPRTAGGLPDGESCSGTSSGTPYHPTQFDHNAWFRTTREYNDTIRQRWEKSWKPFLIKQSFFYPKQQDHNRQSGKSWGYAAASTNNNNQGFVDSTKNTSGGTSGCTQNPRPVPGQTARLLLIVNHAIGDANALQPLLKTFLQLSKFFQNWISAMDQEKERVATEVRSLKQKLENTLVERRAKEEECERNRAKIRKEDPLPNDPSAGANRESHEQDPCSSKAGTCQIFSARCEGAVDRERPPLEVTASAVPVRPTSAQNEPASLHPITSAKRKNKRTRPHWKKPKLPRKKKRPKNRRKKRQQQKKKKRRRKLRKKRRQRQQRLARRACCREAKIFTGDKKLDHYPPVVQEQTHGECSSGSSPVAVGGQVPPRPPGTAACSPDDLELFAQESRRSLRRHVESLVDDGPWVFYDGVEKRHMLLSFEFISTSGDNKRRPTKKGKTLKSSRSVGPPPLSEEQAVDGAVEAAPVAVCSSPNLYSCAVRMKTIPRPGENKSSDGGATVRVGGIYDFALEPDDVRGVVEEKDGTRTTSCNETRSCASFVAVGRLQEPDSPRAKMALRLPHRIEWRDEEAFGNQEKCDWSPSPLHDHPDGQAQGKPQSEAAFAPARAKEHHSPSTSSQEQQKSNVFLVPFVTADLELDADVDRLADFQLLFTNAAAGTTSSSRDSMARASKRAAAWRRKVDTLSTRELKLELEKQSPGFLERATKTDYSTGVDDVADSSWKQKDEKSGKPVVRKITNPSRVRIAVPPLPTISTFDVLEERLKKGLFWNHVQNHSLGNSQAMQLATAGSSSLTPYQLKQEHILFSDAACAYWAGPLQVKGWGMQFFLNIERTAMVLVKRVSKTFQIPVDHILCAVIGIAYYQSTLATHWYYENVHMRRKENWIYQPAAPIPSSRQQPPAEVEPKVGGTTEQPSWGSTCTSNKLLSDSKAKDAGSAASLVGSNPEQTAEIVDQQHLLPTILEADQVVQELTNKSSPAQEPRGQTASNHAMQPHSGINDDAGTKAQKSNDGKRPGEQDVDVRQRNNSSTGPAVDTKKTQGSWEPQQNWRWSSSRRSSYDEWKSVHPKQWGSHLAYYVNEKEYLPYSISSDNFEKLKPLHYAGREMLENQQKLAEQDREEILKGHDNSSVNDQVRQGSFSNAQWPSPPTATDTLKQGILPYRILVPNRDGANEEELVANVVVDRTFELNLRSKTYYGAISELSQILRDRSWKAPAATDPWLHQRISLNIRPAVKEVFPGVTQVLDWAHTKPNPRKNRKWCEAPLDAFVDEQSSGEWTLQMALREGVCAPGFTLAMHFFETLQRLATNPFQEIQVPRTNC